MQSYRRFTYPLLFGVMLAAPFIMSDAYLRHLLVMSLIFAALVLSLDLIIGRTGQFSFGHAAFFGIGAYTSGLLSIKLGMPVWLGFLAGSAVAAVFGLVIGYIAFQTRAFYLAIITMCFALIIYLVANHWYDLTGGTGGLVGIPPLVLGIPHLFRMEFLSELSYYYVALALLVFTMYVINRLMSSRFGRSVTALRESEDLAVASGVPAFKYYLMTFTIATALAGLAGASYAHFIRVIGPDTISMYIQFAMLIMLIVGGLGTIGGPVLGAVFFVFVPDLLQIAEEFRLLIFGVILLLCIIFVPRGIYPALVSLWDRIVHRAWGKGRHRQQLSR